ncbi:MAG: XdhC family protein [Anaerolineae bacterium]|nr:XdhC family protein [Anaerolineae bacterium]
MLDILDTVDQWIAQNRPVALATVVETWGSAPRGVGSKMAITDDMAMIGSVSGGCVETAVIEQALEILEENQPRLLHFGVSDDTAWEVGLTCGGRISVFVEPLDPTWWQAAAADVRANQPAATVTLLEGSDAGQKALFAGDGQLQYATPALPDADREVFAQAAQSRHRSGRIPVSERSIMVDLHFPRPHLILIGGVHVAMPLQSFARQLGFRVSVIDPRQVFATPERFPDVETILHSYPDKALPQLGLDRNTYIAVLTHDPKIDDKALLTALPSAAPYIGVLSSTRTHEQRVQRLREAGLPEEHLSRIRTPIGLDIRAQTPEEIALCIMAEIVAVRNGAQL